MKKKIIISIVTLSVCTAVLLLVYRENRVIGEVRGVEFDRLVIGEKAYSLHQSSDISSADKGAYLGKATAQNESLIFRLYTVKGDPDNKYIYATWDWEGFVYVRTEQ